MVECLLKGLAPLVVGEDVVDPRVVDDITCSGVDKSVERS